MINWGIIGAGNIANRFVDGLSFVSDAHLYAVACRTKKKAEAFKEKHPCNVAYSSYDDLLNDDNIDAVYIALPHLYHFEWAKKAMLKNKAVLVEKPATMNLEEIAELKKISDLNNIFFMEAMKTRFIPAYLEIKKLIKDQVIGEILEVQASFCSDVKYNEASYLFDKRQGGCLLDVGIYPISYLDDFIGGEISNLELEYLKHECGVDSYIKAKFDFEGKIGIIECAIDRYKPRTNIIIGTLGKIVISEGHRPVDFEVILNDGSIIKNHIDYEYNDFYSQIKHVNDCLINQVNESKIMSKDNSIRCAKMIELIKEMIK